MNIPRVDFVVENITDVLANYPDSYRASEINWLLENAGKNNYKLVGNSWIRTNP